VIHSRFAEQLGFSGCEYPVCDDCGPLVASLWIGAATLNQAAAKARKARRAERS